MSNTGYALAREEMVRALTAYNGITTAAGAVVGVRGTTLIDSNLIGSNDFISGKTVLIMSGDAKYEDKGALSFAPLTGTITLRGTGVSTQIVAGTIFKILNISSVEVDVANIQEDLGDMADAPTSDDMSDILTTSALAKLRLILNRLSPDAFAATIQGASRTELDTMLAQLAAYFAVAGAAFTIKVNNQTPSPNLQGLLNALNAVIGCDGTNVFNPRIRGANRLTIEDALHNLAEYIAVNGDAITIQVNGVSVSPNLQGLLNALNAVIGCDGTNIFNPKVNGINPLTVEAAFHELAHYFATNGDALSIQINGRGARTDLQNLINDLAFVLGAEGPTVFGPKINGADRATIDAALENLAKYIAVNGDAISIDVNGVTPSPNIQGLLNALFDVLGCDGANVFNPKIWGANRLTLDDALDNLAHYFVAAGNAFTIQVNNNPARSDLQNLLNDFFTVMGIDGANVFNPTIGGSARTTVEAAFAAIGTELAALVAATGLFHEQADVPLSFNTVNGSETNVLNLVVASTRYIVRSLRLKFADPGAETITVRLYELVNDVLTEVDSFEVTTANFGTYHSLMDMFGMTQLAGDNLKVTTRVSAGADIATLGQYSHAKTNV